MPVVHRFRSPTNGNGVFWYSFDYSPILHVVMLSSEHHLSPGSAQHDWLVEDLTRVRGGTGSGTPWVVVTLHRMLYTTQLCEEGDYANSLLLRSQLEPILRKYRVNLVLVGHQHSFERSCAVYEGRCSEEGTVHVTVGTGGAGVERCGFDSSGHHGKLSLSLSCSLSLSLSLCVSLSLILSSFFARLSFLSDSRCAQATSPWPELTNGVTHASRLRRRP
eukprot:COSAG03_NODE_411_length_8142_cov_5.225289_3_plen_219_part_00